MRGLSAPRCSRWSPWRRFAALVAALVVLVALSADAEAKLGGGQSFKGGSGGTRRSSSSSTRGSSSSSRSSWSSSRSSSSSSSRRSYSSSSHRSTPINWGGVGREFHLSRSCCVLIATALIVIGIIWYLASASAPQRTTYHRPVQRAVEPESVVTRGDEGWLGYMRRQDPNFSVPAFLDFAVLLYMRAQERLEAVRPYVLPEALSQVPRMSGAETVCVGGTRILDAQLSGPRTKLHVRFEASATLADGRTICSHETWTFARPRDLISKEPEQLTALGCPACGHPGECRPDGSCTRYGEVVTNGKFGWAVAKVDVEKRWTQQSDEVGSGGGGNDRPPPTAIDSDLPSAKRAFMARNPGFSFQGFERECTRTYLALQEAWTEKKFEKARPYESDAIFQTHRFWIEAYKRYRRTNVLKDVQVKKIQTVKVARDAFYDAITVRIWMSMIDYTKDDETGKVLAGSPSAKSHSTEYWTFVRRSAHKETRIRATGGSTAVQGNDPGKNCPSCGAPVQINMAGVCEHCDTKVTSGEFGWVLSRIDQDSVYEG